MPPKKNNDKTTSSVKKPREQKTNIKKEKKLPLKIPTVIRTKLKLPGRNLASDTNESARLSKNLSKSALTQAKIDLANEVSRLQLIKPKEEDAQEEALPTPKPKGRKRAVIAVTKNGIKDAGAKKMKLVRKKKETPVIDVPEPCVKTECEPEIIPPTPRGRKKLQEVTGGTEKSVVKKSGTKKKNVEPIVDEATAKSTSTDTKKRGRPAFKKTTGVSTTAKPKPTRKRPAKSASDTVQAPIKHIEATLGEPEKKRRKPKKQVQSEGNVTSFPPIIQKNDAATPSEPSRCSSVNSCFSWTKDISNSSTTTCITVSHTDFVCIDKKLPIIQLYNINNKYDKVEVNKPIVMERHSLSESEVETDRRDDESSSSSSSSSVSSLDLSTSSTSQEYSVINKQDTIESNDSIAYALEKMTAKLNTIDLDIIEWIGHDTEGNVEMQKFQEKVLKVLKHENEIIMHCNNLQRVLSEDIATEFEMEKISDDVFVKPAADVSKYVSDKSEDDDIFTSRDSRNKSLDETYNSEGDSPNLKSMLADNDVASISRRVSLDQNYNDDDDALSLYAESFTMESRISTAPSVAPTEKDLNTNLNTKFEEYVPESLNKSFQSISYKPTKIEIPKPSKPKQITEANKTKLVCEKQNADSTSIYRDTDQYKVPFDTPSKSSFEAINSVLVAATIPKVVQPPGKQACLLVSGYSPIPASRSSVFKGVCFYNLINSCKKNLRCNYPHIQIDLPFVKERLKSLSEVKFIQEYMSMRMWPILRRRYGILFVEECIRRELTRVLIEIALDFVMKTTVNSHEDTEVLVQVVEQTLIYLNQIDLSQYRELLNINVGDGVRLCDVFMKSIAETQNFSRFKQVFTNLTNFMIDNRRKISLDVATHILERVCILPCEETLYRTLLKILNNTDNAIFNDPMIHKFDQNISQLSSELHGEYLLSKGANLEMSLMAGSLGTLLNAKTNSVPEQMTNTLVQTEVKRYTSPDTTKIDNMKPTPMPRITRTIVNNLPHTITGINDQQIEQNRPNPNFQKWMNKSIFQKPWSGPTKHVNRNMYGRSPPNFSRRSGPADYH